MCVIVNNEMDGNIAIESKIIVIIVITDRRSVLDLRRLSEKNHSRLLSLEMRGMRLRPVTNALVFARQPAMIVRPVVVGGSRHVEEKSKDQQPANVAHAPCRMMKRYIPYPLGDVSAASASDVSTVKKFPVRGAQDLFSQAIFRQEYVDFRVRKDRNICAMKAVGVMRRRVLCTQPDAPWKHMRCR